VLEGRPVQLLPGDRDMPDQPAHEA
jgi:hypothetical protein